MTIIILLFGNIFFRLYVTDSAVSEGDRRLQGWQYLCTPVHIPLPICR